MALLVSPSSAEARPATSRHIGWEVERVTFTPYSAGSLELRVAGSDGVAGRYSVTAHANGRRYQGVPGQPLTISLGAAAASVRIEVSDLDGGEPYRETVTVPRGARTQMTVTSSWSHPGHPGTFTNDTANCSRPRTLRFQVRVPGDLSVGRPVEVAPGQAVSGPRLPDGDYTVWIKRPSGAEVWPVAASRTLSVRGGAYRFDAGCLRDRYAGR